MDGPGQMYTGLYVRDYACSMYVVCKLMYGIVVNRMS